MTWVENGVVRVVGTLLAIVVDAGRELDREVDGDVEGASEAVLRSSDEFPAAQIESASHVESRLRQEAEIEIAPGVKWRGGIDGSTQTASHHALELEPNVTEGEHVVVDELLLLHPFVVHIGAIARIQVRQMKLAALVANDAMLSRDAAIGEDDVAIHRGSHQVASAM